MLVGPPTLDHSYVETYWLVYYNLINNHVCFCICVSSLI